MFALLVLVLSLVLVATDAFVPAPQRLNRSKRTDRQAGSQGNDDPLFPEKLNIIFDGKCSVCQMEVDYLQSRIDGHFHNSEAIIRFTDLEAAEGYNEDDPANGGVTYEMGMRSFHAVKPNGEIIHGVPVFREAYEIVDQAWVFAATNIPIVGRLASFFYEFFARIRTQLTRGSTVDDLIEEHYRRKKLELDEKDCVPCQKQRDDQLSAW